MKPSRFIIVNAESIARLVNSHGPRPPQLTGDELHDQSTFSAWMAAVALLAQGHEPGCHDGSTFYARVQAAKGIIAAFKA